MMRRFALLFCIALTAAGCAKMEADKREAVLRRIYDHQGVVHKPYALDDKVKQACHDHIRQDILSSYDHPQSWTLFKELAPMDKATFAYAKRANYTLPDEDNPERPYSTEHMAFYMTKYLGEDFAGNGAESSFVCQVKVDNYGIHLETVSSLEGFRRTLNLPLDEPTVW